MTNSLSLRGFLMGAFLVIGAEALEGESTVVGFTEVTPGQAVSASPSARAWHRVEDSSSPSGWRLETAVDTIAPDIRLPLSVTGVHEIRIGVYMPDTLTSGVYARLDTQPDFAFFRGRLHGRYPCYDETLCTTADCTGRSLILRQPAEYRSYVTHVRLIPRKQVPHLPSATKDVLGLDCTFHRYYFFAMREPGTSAAGVNMHGLCGFTEEVFCCGRSVLTYETKVGTAHKTELNRPRTHWLHDHSVTNTPLKTALEAADRVGITLSTRLSMNCHYHGAYENALTSEFVLGNANFHARRRNGSVDNHRMCYGYPEVRAERVAIFRELIQVGSRHLFVDCRRYMPMTQWGTPYIEGFTAEHGIDPRKLTEDDPRWCTWLRWRADSFTQVLRDIQAMLRETGHSDVSVTLRVNADAIAKNLEHGVDLEQMVKEKLISRLVLGERDSRRFLPDYLRLLEGTEVKLLGCLSVHGSAMPGPEHHTKGNWPTAMYQRPDVDRLTTIVQGYYAAGLDGVAFYETDEATAMPGMREFFIACRSPESLADFAERRRTAWRERLRERFPGFTFEQSVKPRITSTIGPIDGKSMYRIEHAIDGDLSTHYIADRACCRPDGPGCMITLEFPVPVTTQGIAMVTRAAGGVHDWAPRELTVEYLSDGQWQETSGMPATGLSGPDVMVRFDQVETTGLRLHLRNVTGGAKNPDIRELTWK